MKFEWESIGDNFEDDSADHWKHTLRAKVIGGWLVRFECAWNYRYYNNTENTDAGEGWSERTNSMIFVPDVNHEWVIDND